MLKTHTKTPWLAALLVLQLILAVALYWGHNGAQDNPNDQPLFAIKAAAVDQIQIEDGSKVINLKKISGHWKLPKQLPVDETKLNTLLDNLANIRGNWPIATTSGSQSRFEVSADNYQRHVQLFENDKKVAEFYLGTSPSFRKVHLRKADDDAIYSVELNNYEVSTAANDWLDQTLLAIKAVDRLKGNSYALTKVAEQWQWVEGTDAEATAALDQAKAEQLATKLATLRVSGIATTPPKSMASQTIEVSHGSEHWRLTLVAEEGNHFIQRNDRADWFILAKSDYEALTAPALTLEKKIATQADEVSAESESSQTPNEVTIDTKDTKDTKDTNDNLAP